MADLPISGLPAATPPLAGTELLPVVQGGVTDRCTSAQLINTAAPITNINVTGGAINGTPVGATTAASGAFTTLGAATVTFVGGTINNTTIGNVTPAVGHFSTMFTADANITGGTIDGTKIGSSVPESAVFTSSLTSEAGTSGSYYPLIKNLGFDATLTSVTTVPAIVANYSFPANFFTTPGQYLTYEVYLNASSSAGSDSFTLATSFVVGAGVAFSSTSLIPITLSTSPQVVRLTLKVIIVAGNIVKFDFNVYSATTPNVGAPNYIQDIADSGSFAPSQTCQVLLAVSGSATCTVQYIHSSIVGT